MRRLPFFSDCVGWPREQLDALRYLVDNGKDIEVDWFVRNVERGDLFIEELVSWHRRGTHGTTFFRLPGEPVFWLVNSMIEYVFADAATIARLEEGAHDGDR